MTPNPDLSLLLSVAVSVVKLVGLILFTTLAFTGGLWVVWLLIVWWKFWNGGI